MLRIIELLAQKNHYLENFYSVNEGEILNFARNDFSGLEAFYQTREKILEAIRYIDSEIEKSTAESQATASPEQKREISQSLAIKDEYVGRILSQDLEVLACIEAAKSGIIRELQDIKKTKKAVGSYKSKTFNNRLDEEV